MSKEDSTSAIARVVLFLVLVVAFQVAVGRLALQREAKRRWQHALTGQALVLVSYYLPRFTAVPALLVGATGIGYLRYFQPDSYMQAFGPLLRENERQENQLPGAFYFLIGTALSVQMFPIQVARYAVLCLSWADPIAAWVGRSFPLVSLHKSASLGGCLGCFSTAILIGRLVLDPSTSWTSIVVGAVGCTIAEASPVGNDNLLIPLVTGAALQLSR